MQRDRACHRRFFAAVHKSLRLHSVFFAPNAASLATVYGSGPYKYCCVSLPSLNPPRSVKHYNNRVFLKLIRQVCGIETNHDTSFSWRHFCVYTFLRLSSKRNRVSNLYFNAYASKELNKSRRVVCACVCRLCHHYDDSDPNRKFVNGM